MSAQQGSQLWPDYESGSLPFYWRSNGQTHACEGAEVVPDQFLAWTKCGADVPANEAYYLAKGRIEEITCPKCLAQIAEGS